MASLLAASLALAAGCSERQAALPAPGSSAPSATATGSSAPAQSAQPAPTIAGDSDEIRPVYPLDAAPHPLAQRFCEAIHILPEKRKGECCGAATSPALEGVAGLCVRTLSYALGSGAVTLAPADVDACVAALGKATTGCDWVKPFALELGPACDGIVKGTLAEKAPCRSSLECGEGMRCLGLSTVDPGTCGPPKPARYPCNLAVDVLAGHTRQASLERAHPECAGFCTRSVCQDAVADGAACSLDLQCGRGRCEAGKCTHAPPPGPGEACVETCAPGARCARGKCVAPKGEGEGCEENEDCRAMCVRGDGGAAGKCEKLCAMPAPRITLPSKKPPRR